MKTPTRQNLGGPAFQCAVVLAGLLLGLFLGPPSSPSHVRALDNRMRGLALPGPGELSVVVNAILYDVVTFGADLPVILNNAP
jgi:hypothetical protein